MHGDWLVAIATIAAAVLGIVGGLLLSRYQGERRRVRFIATAPEDLSAALRQHKGFQIRFGSYTVEQLNLASIIVRNTGNMTIDNFQFSLIIPGQHVLAIAQATSANDKLSKSITFDYPSIKESTDPQFEVSVPFFNPGEEFRIRTFADAAPARCNVSCRIRDVSVQVTDEDDFTTQTRRIKQYTIGFTVLYLLIISIAATFNFIYSESAESIVKRLQSVGPPQTQPSK